MALGDALTIILGIVLLQIWILGDCVDGLVALYNGKSSVLGAFIDSWNVNSIYVLSLTSIGAGLSRMSDLDGLTLFRTLLRFTPDKNVYLVIGLYTSFIYSLYRWFGRSVTGATPVKKRTDVAAYPTSVLKNMFSHVYSLTNYHGFYIPMLLIVTFLGITSLYLLFLAFMHTTHFIGYAIYALRHLGSLRERI